jgi:2-polyprenyl-3-methyl-5-hydroxy-6-metoxy-1,4-benzoquinol methylase
MTIKLNKLRSHIEKQNYDKKYQDIEVLDFLGYSESYKSWNNINKLNIDWTNKRVCDLGCFHSYFGIKAIKAGAKSVIGLDVTMAAIETSKIICELSNVDIKFLKWCGGEDIPACDIAMCLNMLHHCEDQDLTLSKIHSSCRYGLFEVNTNQRSLIEKYFNTISETNSDRTNSSDSTKRVIIFTESKNK